MLKRVFKESFFSYDNVQKDKANKLIETVHNNRKYALVSVEYRSPWLFCLKAIGMTCATAYTLGLGCLFKVFRDCLVNNWKATFSKNERKIERYELIKEPEDKKGQGADQGERRSKSEAAKKGAEPEKKSSIKESEGSEKSERSKQTEGVKKVQEDQPIQVVQNNTQKNPTTEFYWYMDPKRAVDMPYLQEFFATHFPGLKQLPAEEVEKFQKAREDQKEPTKSSSKPKACLYFDICLTRVDTGHLRDDMACFEKQLGKPGAVVMIYDTALFKPEHSESHTKDLKNDLQKNTKVISGYFKTEWDQTGYGKNKVVLLNQAELAKDIQSAMNGQ